MFQNAPMVYLGRILIILVLQLVHLLITDLLILLQIYVSIFVLTIMIPMVTMLMNQLVLVLQFAQHKNSELKIMTQENVSHNVQILPNILIMIQWNVLVLALCFLRWCIFLIQWQKVVFLNVLNMLTIAMATLLIKLVYLNAHLHCMLMMQVDYV